MKKYMVIYLVALIGILALASTAAAKDRLWIAKEAAQEHASQRESYDQERALDVSTEDQLKGQRLWIARQQAGEHAEPVEADSYRMATTPATTLPGSLKAPDQKPLVCEKDVPGFTYYMVRHYGDASERNVYCN